jgi:hypothetical protein
VDSGSGRLRLAKDEVVSQPMGDPAKVRARVKSGTKFPNAGMQ